MTWEEARLKASQDLREHLKFSQQRLADDLARQAASFTYVDLQPVPRYAELNPGGTTDIVHVITTLEAR